MFIRRTKEMFVTSRYRYPYDCYDHPSPCRCEYYRRLCILHIIACTPLYSAVEHLDKVNQLTGENTLSPINPSRPPVFRTLGPLNNFNPISGLEIQISIRLSFEIIQSHDVLPLGLRRLGLGLERGWRGRSFLRCDEAVGRRRRIGRWGNGKMSRGRRRRGLLGEAYGWASWRSQVARVNGWAAWRSQVARVDG